MMVTVWGCVQEPVARQVCAADQDSTKYTTSTGWGAGSTRPAKGGFPGSHPPERSYHALAANPDCLRPYGGKWRDF